MNIEKKLIKYNYSSRNGKKIEYIVIHDTGNKGKGANADAHYNYFNGGNRNASAHYFVDSQKILQLVDDSNASWHCGDGKGKFGITNQNSIGIEICVNLDGNYEKAVANAIELTKYLMKKYNIPLEKVVRHYDASRKLCPASMSASNWSKWQWFKEQLKENQIIIPDWPIMRLGSRGEYVRKLQEKLNEFGYNLAVDGSFGPATDKAVRDFQKKKGLVVDGYVGPATRKALFE